MKVLPRFKWLLFLTSAVLVPQHVIAQQKEVVNNNQVWLGYITSVTINTKYSLWNDFHFVPQSFFVARTGLTYHTKTTGLTAGYGFLLLPVSAMQKQLMRKEHRPWAQFLRSSSLSKSISIIQRVRYDARFKQEVANSDLQPSFVFTNRIRFLVGLRATMPGASAQETYPFLAASNELLLNFGKNVNNGNFDQNRVQVSVGIQHKSMQYQVGYMNRFLQTGNARYTANHTILFWVVHKIKMRSATTASHNRDVSHDD
jgi:hypothetical protein